MKKLLLVCACVGSFQSVFAFDPQSVKAKLTPFSDHQKSVDQIVLKNDSFAEEGGQAYLQMGFVEGEMAGVFLSVPPSIENFKIDSFRVLLGDNNMLTKLAPMSFADVTVYFQMGILKAGSPSFPNVPRDIDNAASVVPGGYWNDIPAQSADGSLLKCAHGGDRIGAAIEFTHAGLPSVYRDLDGLSSPANNSIFAVPGGWGYSSRYGVRGDWLLRVVGHKASAEECGN